MMNRSIINFLRIYKDIKFDVKLIKHDIFCMMFDNDVWDGVWCCYGDNYSVTTPPTVCTAQCRHIR